jgi:hypothetical protein
MTSPCCGKIADRGMKFRWEVSDDGPARGLTHHPLKSRNHRASLHSRDDLDRSADRKTEVAVGAPQVDRNFGEPVRILIPEGRA